MKFSRKLSRTEKKETLLENSMQPLINEALELSTTVDSQLKVLKDYDAIAQEKASEASAAVLQELVEKEQATDNIMRGLNKQFTIFVDKVHLPEE